MEILRCAEAFTTHSPLYEKRNVHQDVREHLKTSPCLFYRKRKKVSVSTVNVQNFVKNFISSGIFLISSHDHTECAPKNVFMIQQERQSG